MSTTRANVAAFIASRRPGWTLERSFYVDAEIYALDMERIYRRHWLLAGPSCRAGGVGDWFTYEIGDDSIVFVRDETLCIRAFHNVCRHRGSRICLEGDGRDKLLVCPYHNWSYRLDGALAHARHLPPEIERGELAMHAVETREVAGLIFVCLADSPPPFDATAADIADFFAPFQLEKTQICRRTVDTIRANWKVVADNFWECYHCQPTHPEFCSVMSYAHAQNNERLAEARSAFEREWRERAKLRPGRIDLVVPGANGLHQGGRTPIRPGFLTQSQDGKPVAPLLGELQEYDGAVASFMQYPLIWYVVSNDYALLTRFTPRGPLETELELTWLVRDGAVAGRDYDVERVCWLWRITAEQDKTICENNQRGILSSRYQPGPYATTETSVDEFVGWYLSELSSE